MRTKFQDDQFRHLSNITVITATVREAVILVLLIEGNYDVRRWDGFTYDVSWRFKQIKVLPQIFESL
jgi:hypothetical protein